MKSTLIPLCAFMQILLGEKTGIYFVDSMVIKACHIRREKQNKVFREFAKKGKSTMGWFFGFNVTRLKSNMKNKLMPLIDKILLRKRALVETVNDQLKNISQIEHTRHRSIWNFMVNFLAALAAYALQPKKPSLNLARNEQKMMHSMAA